MEEHSNRLEKMVAARTAELAEANKKLRHEIDQRKRAQEALKESAEKYKSLVNNVKLGVFRNTPGPIGKFLEVNPAMEEITGYSRDELLAMNVSDLYERPQERRAFSEEIAALVGKTITKELRFRKKDGTQIVVSDTTVAVRDDAGQVQYFDGILEDITERKRAEEALKESEERYRALVEASGRMGEAIVLLQNTDKVEAAHLFANQEWVRITGYTPEQLREISYLALVHPRHRDAVADRVRRLFQGKLLPGPWEISIMAKDGTEVPVEATGTRITYRDRPAVVGYIRDITERNRVEEEIKRRAAQAMLGYEVGQRVSSKLELDELLSEIVTAVRDAFDYYGVMILLVNEEAQHLTMQSIAGGYADIFPRDLYHAIGAGMTGYAVASGKTQVSGNVSKDPHYVREADEETKSELAVPIKKGQKVIGVLDIQSNEFDAFDETGVMLIKTLADQIAVAIENARLYEAVQQELAERKKAGEEIKYQRKYFQALFEGSPEAVASLDVQNRFMDINPAFEKMFGYKLEDVKGKDIDDCVVPRSRKEEGKSLGRRARTGEVVVAESIRKRADGREIPVSILIAPIILDGKQIGIFAIYRDITERKQAEEALRESEERFIAMLQSIGDNVCMMDKDFNIIWANEATKRVFGNDVIGKKCYKAFHRRREPCQPRPCPTFQAFQNGKVHEYDSQTIDKDGEKVYFRVAANVALRDKEGKPEAVLEASRNITELKRAQAEREVLLKDLKEVNRRLEQSNQELQDFAYVASHDLREPLRKIASFSTLLQDSLEGKLDDDQQENFEFMIDGAKRMQTMIDDLLAYSRLTTKARPFKQVNLNDVIEDLKKLELATLLDETKGTIHVPQPLPPVHGDPSQIRQLLQNLVGNGLKFHREGVPPEITIRAHVDDNMVELEVQDNGIGIAEEYHKQVFTMFKRLHSREHYGGTGIGLAVCQKIVDRHGGSIGVKSTPGEGSTFWFTLPREAVQQTNGQRSNDHNG